VKLSTTVLEAVSRVEYLVQTDNATWLMSL